MTNKVIIIMYYSTFLEKYCHSFSRDKNRLGTRLVLTFFKIPHIHETYTNILKLYVQIFCCVRLSTELSLQQAITVLKYHLDRCSLAVKTLNSHL